MNIFADLKPDMEIFGALIALFTAMLWTTSSMLFEYASKRASALNVNLIRLCFAFVFLAATLLVFSGSCMPLYADAKTWMWMIFSGIAGFVICDFSSFSAYRIISARYTQLIMTLSPPTSALLGWIALGETLSPKAAAGMFLTLFGIAISIFGKSEDEGGKKPHLLLPAKGIILSLIAALGQGTSIVLSKIGMNCYNSSMSAAGAAAGFGGKFYIPLSGTMMRIIAAVICFALIITLRGGIKNFFSFAVKDKSVVKASVWGGFLGTFVGVVLSLVALTYTSAAVTSTLLSTVPILIILPNRMIYHRKISAKQTLGAFISVAGVALFFM